MVFAESTFVLTKAPAKAAAEPTEPVVPDPSMKLEAPQQPAPALDLKSPDTEAEVKRTPTTTASKIPKSVESSQKAEQTTPKREPRRPQWDTSLVNKARNAPRKPHQPQWSPAGAASRKVRPDSAKSAGSWTPPTVSLSQNSNLDPHRSPAQSAGSPVKHPSPWTLEGESVLDRTDEDEGNAAEEARKESAEEDALKKPTRRELHAQALEKGWVGNGTGPQVGDPDAEEEAAPQTDLKKTSPNQRFGGLEGIIRTFTGDGPEGMTGHGKHPNGMPYISCRAGGAEDDKTGTRGAKGARRGRSGAKASCMGCNVM